MRCARAPQPRLTSRQLLPPAAYPNTPAASFATKFVHVSVNKVRAAVDVVAWTPEGRRLLTGSQIGEFTLWNGARPPARARWRPHAVAGTSFNFETILQAHDTAIRSLQWAHNENWLISGDDGGVVKYWQPNMNNVKATQAHKEPVRGLAFAPSDLKFCSCSDDTTVKARGPVTSGRAAHPARRCGTLRAASRSTCWPATEAT